MQIFVVIASAGRPDAVAELAEWSARLTAPVDSSLAWILSTPTEADAPANLPANWTLMTGRRGLTSQRNHALEQLPSDTDFVFFFDDDALPRPDYVCAAVDHFEAHPDQVAITGRLLRDGAVEKVEVSWAESVAELEQSWDHPVASWSLTRELYGCNFAIRWSVLQHLRFEERLPLYSWLEDLDYSGQALKIGELAKVSSAVAVHRAIVSGGRAQHLRLGYSQIANPALLVEKGTLPLGTALVKAGRPALRNLAGLLVPKEHRDRLDRTKGNFLAIGDLIASGGHSRPERILEL